MSHHIETNLRVLVTGSRDWADAEAIHSALDDFPVGTTIIHGDCKTGTDAIASRIARARGFSIEVVPTEWWKHAAGWCRCRAPLPKHCKAALLRRNAAMIARQPHLVLDFPLPSGTGARDAVNRATQAGIPVRTVRVGRKSFDG